MRRLEIRFDGETRVVDIDDDADIGDLKAALRPNGAIILKDQTGRTWLDCFDVADVPEDVRLEAWIDEDEEKEKGKEREKAERDGRRMTDMYEQTRASLKRNPELVKQVLENPTIQHLLGDPKRLMGIIENNPSLHHLPGMKTLLEDPEKLKKAQAVARNPEKLQRALQQEGPRLRSMTWHLRPFPWISETVQIYV